MWAMIVGQSWLRVLVAAAFAAGASCLAPGDAKAQMDWFWKGAAKRNQEDRERIIAVLTHQNVISVRDGRVLVHQPEKLKEYYQYLKESGKLSNMSQFHEDKHDTKAGQFWQNFFDRKDHERGDMPASADPFANDNSGLATKMHGQLREPGSGSHDYALTASDLKMRRIDVLDTELRRGASAGADAIIKALNALTGGASEQAVKWAEAAAKAAQAAKQDPKAAIERELKSRYDEKVSDVLTDQLKAAMGEDNYDRLMKGYEKISDRQQRTRAIMDDLYKRTGDERFKDASELLEKTSVEKLASDAAEKTKELLKGAAGEKSDAAKSAGEKKAGDGKTAETDKEGKDGKDGKEVAGGGEGKSKTGETGKPKTGETGKTEPKDKGVAAPPQKSWEEMTDEEKRAALKANDPKAWDAYRELLLTDPQRAVAILDAKPGSKDATKKPKSWDEMTDEERREALKANDPAAWEAYRKLLLTDPQRAVAIIDAGKRKPADTALAPTQPTAPTKPATRDDIMKGLRALNHTKLQAALRDLGISPTLAFFNCLCQRAGYGAMGTGQYYHPDTIGEYNPAYSCSQPGPPCVVSGFGCSRHPLPSDPKVWEACMNDWRVNVETKDGKPVPGSGERLDEMIERKLREREGARKAG